MHVKQCFQMRHGYFVDDILSKKNLKISSKIITLDEDLSNIDGIHGKLQTTTINVDKLSTKACLLTILLNRVMRYINDTWLNKYKEMFVSVWVDQHLNFGNSTTNRAEIVQSQLTSINQNFENSLTVRYNHHNLSCFQLLCGHVSNQALDIIL
uniref:Uncharacterized protein n=1 Tax=Lactuca sativa TaxID=4236 RepID=A0A9R1VVW8_LACSA|nr:hypothetical protein LSAT_V11C400163510 [Lactuca sativa]